MRLTIQPGIDANDLAQAIYETIKTGMEVDAAAARKLHDQRMALIKRGGGQPVPVPQSGQGRLFE